MLINATITTMKLPKELTTVTKLSKYLAMVVFVSLPIVGFFFGMRYQEMVDLTKRQEMEENLSIPRTPTPTPIALPTVDPSVTANWKTHTSRLRRYTIMYPSDWETYLWNAYDGSKLPDQKEEDPGELGLLRNFESKNQNEGTIVLSVNVNVSEVGYKDSIESYKKAQKVDKVSYALTNIKIGNIDAVRVDGYFKDIIRSSEVYILKGKDMYQISVGKKSEIFDQILSTFKFTQ